MHIEPGFISGGKIMMASAAALGVGGAYAKELIAKPAFLGRTLIAAGFFTLFMQAFHLPVGPSELHFVGAMMIYLTLGFIPTLFGFALGLLAQGLLFAPADLAHLAVNTLSLVLPLIGVHYTIGRKFRTEAAPVTFAAIARMDGLYYAGVTGMVGFWLSMSAVATPLAAWAAFASSYLIIVAAETCLTYAAVRALKSREESRVVEACFDVRSLNHG